ncbi:MAG: histidinol dehydrogenase, partial [Actinobacteria bacterium]|nr:histidinol dehydrogenase [Actinomycetota bacterium]
LAEEVGSETVSEGTVNLVHCDSRDLATQFVNSLAPEHLELMVEDLRELLPEIKSAGCVFIGLYSPVVLGDYLAGPSHVLPTGGSAARLSGLSTQSFKRTMNVVSYSKEGFLADSKEARVLARLEGLEIHALSIDARLKENT